MLRRGVFACVVIALTGCSGMTSLPDPTREEVGHAIESLRQSIPASVIYPSFGEAQNCRPGTMGDTPVLNCSVCAVMVRAEHSPIVGIQGVRARRGTFDLAFARALSHNQPHVVPADGSPGVWVVRAAASTFQETAARDLDGSDFAQLGLTVQRSFGGAQHYSVRRPGYIGVIPNAQILLEFLSTPEAQAMVESSVGRCDSAG